MSSFPFLILRLTVERLISPLLTKCSDDRSVETVDESKAKQLGPEQMYMGEQQSKDVTDAVRVLIHENSNVAVRETRKIRIVLPSLDSENPLQILQDFVLLEH